MIEPGSVSRIVSTTSSCACMAGPSSAQAASRAALGPRRAVRVRPLPARPPARRQTALPSAALQSAWIDTRRRPARELVGVDVDADQVRRQDEAAIAIHVVVGRAEFGAGGDHQIGLGHQRAHGLQARAGRHAERVAMQQAARIGGEHDRRVERLGEPLQRGLRRAWRRRRQGSAGGCAARGEPRRLGDGARLGRWRQRAGAAAATGRRPACPSRRSGSRYAPGPGRDRAKTARRRGRARRAARPASSMRCGRTAPPSPSCRAGRAVHADSRGPCRASRVALTPEITSIGTESARACAMAVMVLVRPGPVMTKATPGLPRHTRIAVGHEARALLVARRDVADLRARQAAVELDRVHAGNAEHGVDAMGLEQGDQRFADGGHGGSWRSFPQHRAASGRSGRPRRRCRAHRPRRSATTQPAASIAAFVLGKPATAITSRGAVGSTLRLRPMRRENSSASPSTSLMPRALQQLVEGGRQQRRMDQRQIVGERADHRHQMQAGFLAMPERQVEAVDLDAERRREGRPSAGCRPGWCARRARWPASWRRPRRSRRPRPCPAPRCGRGSACPCADRRPRAAPARAGAAPCPWTG